MASANGGESFDIADTFDYVGGKKKSDRSWNSTLVIF